jgi:hypothetical protein
MLTRYIPILVTYNIEASNRPISMTDEIERDYCLSEKVEDIPKY